jgi:hypothetical protein
MDAKTFTSLGDRYLAGMLIYFITMRVFFRKTYDEAATFVRQVLGDVRLAARGRVERTKAGWFEG